MSQHPILKFRKSKGLTLDAFALKVGVQKAAVHKWENGGLPSPQRAIAIEQATGSEVKRWELRPDLWERPVAVPEPPAIARVTA